MAEIDVEPAPATMTLAGRQFLQALAAESTSGCLLEVGPLFGSSTQVIDAGRNRPATIHTIDTFEAAPWVKRRLGIDLSRAEFDKYTGHIADLVVHEGYSPDVVKDTWSEPIGFFFDDATHGDPGWSDNFNFFSTFFTDDAIVCGDDFAGGWPDIPRNVYAIAAEWGAGVYVIGRVWAITRGDEQRIVDAATTVMPALAGATIESHHTTPEGDVERTTPAMCWSGGLHQHRAMTSFRFAGEPLAGMTLTTYAADGSEKRHSAGDSVDLAGVVGLSVEGMSNVGLQLCLTNGHKTENGKVVGSARKAEVPPGQTVVAVRLGRVREQPTG